MSPLAELGLLLSLVIFLVGVYLVFGKDDRE